ncbi:tRNA 2-selenouridine(34) synthase MnmH [Serratia entomophila]|uniref:tRNA 2-selenouridine synthase n=1 Tax=Serratia entomophila TaxID=42906 RepID=A0ABY5CLB3_9GAMM|nr:tRNA 2-selenouridine(34) synthase MnmH [Serratia entomophila]USU99005.1 tRNA 2-selenouridine(34) synthase MnmH [Serratia entomophila]CAI0776296.1 tRNA 2-selenouridine synthase [Serratia entomophila]CAI1017443.1 tRNA 2-selenouridine synthase [Serratia entomophila]CAI1102891.1 tRNA 2-selenouridine synthase [Serratia entomophila]CAI1103672.1 tRNA 2-selenouridine synthase [Serratia entomophila]
MLTVQGRPDTDDYRRIFLQDVPLIDLRAPVEFQQGAFANALNLPLMNDGERQAVGTCYKQQGQQAAIALGHSLVNGRLREQRTAAWLEQCARWPQGYLYCFRGGLRSQLVQQWLREAGVHYPRIAGGYKALRHFLLTTLAQSAELPMVLVGGNTGSGKTLLVNALADGVDLEGAARHRGSSFGRTLAGQSSQIDFENRLAVLLLKKQHGGCRRWVLEDEGRIIGSNNLPLPLFNGMQLAPVAVIDDPFETRLARLQAEYIDGMRAQFEQAYGEAAGWLRYDEYLHQGLFAIRRRLGMERFQQLTQRLEAALQQQRLSGSGDAHRAWLEPLLQHYYDPMYQFQLEKKSRRIAFRGNYAEVREFLMTYSHKNGE